MRRPCSNAARVRVKPVWEGGGEAVWPIEQFMRWLPFFSAIIGRTARLELIGIESCAAEYSWTA